MPGPTASPLALLGFVTLELTGVTGADMDSSATNCTAHGSWPPDLAAGWSPQPALSCVTRMPEIPPAPAIQPTPHSASQSNVTQYSHPTTTETIH